MFSSNNGIDSITINDNLNIGCNNSQIINIGNSNSEINFNNIISINGSIISTSNIREGTNLYYTVERVRSCLSINSISNGLIYDNQTGIISLGLSTLLTTGALSNIDWNIFNNKIDNVGDNMSGFLLFNSSFGIDNIELIELIESNGTEIINTLNIGNINSKKINIGNINSIINFNNHINIIGNIYFLSQNGIDTSINQSILSIGNINATKIEIGNSNSLINFNNKININGSQISTSDVLEGTNLYYTSIRVKSNFSIDTFLANGLFYDNNTGIFYLSLSSSTINGALSSRDWNIFNNKINNFGDTITGNLLFSSLFGIDSTLGSSGILNIGQNNSSIINIGNLTSLINFNNNININGNYLINENQISTSNVLEGENLYFTINRVRTNLSINTIDNGLSYNNTLGIFTLITSSSTTIGALSNTDWNTFNNKVNKNGDLMSGNLLFISSYGIDTLSGTSRILNIGTNNAFDINIGTNNSLNINIGNSSCNINFKNKILIDESQISTSNVLEGNNLYYTTERVR
jgi:hypothetical protein